MYYKVVLPILVLFPAVVMAQQPIDNRVLVMNESKLMINGTSNVTDFSCISEHELEEDTLSFNAELPEDRFEISTSSLVLEIDDFDCGKKAINRDFKQTLKYREHPNINITLNALITESDEEYPTSAEVDIKIAGVTEAFTIPLHNIIYHNNTIYASGSKKLKMSDFGLKPPSPMMGLIKVRDELEVKFDLVIKELLE